MQLIKGRAHALHRLAAMVLGLVVFCLARVAAAALPDPRLEIPFLYHSAWSGKDGAPSGVQALAQSNDGLLWLGAHNGLFSFDGVRFSSVRRVNGIDLPVAEVYALLAPRTGGLWIAYLFGGASFIHEGTVTNYSLADGLPNSTITDMAEGADGAIWAASTAGLFRHSQMRWEDITDRYGLRSRFVRSICIDPEQTVWLNAGGTILYLKAGAYRFETAPWRIDGVNNPYLARSRDGVPWISTRIEGRPAALRLSVHALTKPTAADIIWLDKPDAGIDVVESSGALWIDSGAALTRTVPNAGDTHDASFSNRTKEYPLDQASGPGVQIGFEDREGDIWLGTTGGIDKFRDSRIHKLPRIMGEITIVAAQQGALWVGLDRSPAVPRGLYSVGLETAPRLVPGVERISAGYRSAAGDVWIGGAAGLWHLEQDQWRPAVGPDSLRGQSGADLQGIVEDSDGNLWISVVRSGLYERTVAGWSPYTPKNVRDNDYPIVMISDQKGVIWLGYSRNRLIGLSKEGEQYFASKDGIAVGNVLALASVDGMLWVGGDQGLFYYDGHHFSSVNFASGTPLSGVSGILQSTAGDVWVNTGAGVMHVSSRDLHSWTQRPEEPLKAELFNYLDGMLGSPTPVRPLPTLVEASDGRIWFTTTNGIFWCDPATGAANRIAPNVLVARIIADGVPLEPAPRVLLGKKVRDLEIDYTATSLVIPERVMFKYRLAGRDPQWQDVGARRSAFYTDLPPGRYEFSVTASNNDGVWNAAGQHLTLILPPTVFQTMWFRLICTVAAAALLVVLFLVRLRQMSMQLHRQLEHRFDARVEERTRIARDLHDSLLQGFQGLMFRLQAVRQLLPLRASEAAAQLDTALVSADRSVAEGRDAVRDLRESTLIQGDLGETLGSIGKEFAGAAPTPQHPSYHVVVEGKPQTLDPLVRDEVYRIAREAIRNAFKHARATKIETELVYGPTFFSVRVRDDGIGIDRQVLAQGRRDGHWGLPGMRERASTFKGEFNVWSELGAGSEIELKIPATMAYVRFKRTWWLPKS
jgi:signal transduction histidine kinase/ligand-binding sensor domain-containing protein